MSQYSSKTNTYIVQFRGYVEIHASTQEEAGKIFEEQIIGREEFPVAYSISYEEMREV